MLDLACDAFNKAADAARELASPHMRLWARTQANAIRSLRRRAEQQLGEPEADAPRRPSASSSQVAKMVCIH